jgi:hypothetical protein
VGEVLLSKRRSMSKHIPLPVDPLGGTSSVPCRRPAYDSPEQDAGLAKQKRAAGLCYYRMAVAASSACGAGAAAAAAESGSWTYAMIIVWLSPIEVRSVARAITSAIMKAS